MAAKKKPVAPKETTITAYKAFNADMKCRDFQFEIGKTYTHEGAVEICESGFHSCSNPFDVLNYYDLIDSRFCVVEASGDIKTHADDSKIASAKITVSAEIKLPEFIGTCIKYLIDACTPETAASGYSSKLAASGDYSKLAASGYSSIACNAGLHGRVKGGDKCAMSLAYWNDEEKRFRIVVAYVGENGIKPDVWYVLNNENEFVEAK